MVVKIKNKGIKKCVIKKLKFEIYKNCLEATQLDNKTEYVEKNKINIEFIGNNKSILKTLQRLKSGMHNIFTEQINKIVLHSNEHKIMLMMI